MDIKYPATTNLLDPDALGVGFVLQDELLEIEKSFLMRYFLSDLDVGLPKVFGFLTMTVGAELRVHHEFNYE